MIPWEKWFDDERSFEQVVVRLLVVYALLQCGLGDILQEVIQCPVLNVVVIVLLNLNTLIQWELLRSMVVMIVTTGGSNALCIDS